MTWAICKQTRLVIPRGIATSTNMYTSLELSKGVRPQVKRHLLASWQDGFHYLSHLHSKFKHYSPFIYLWDEKHFVTWVLEIRVVSKLGWDVQNTVNNQIRWRILFDLWSTVNNLIRWRIVFDLSTWYFACVNHKHACYDNIPNQLQSNIVSFLL